MGQVFGSEGPRPRVGADDRAIAGRDAVDLRAPRPAERSASDGCTFDLQFESPANPEISGYLGDQLRVTMRTHGEVVAVPVGGRPTATPPLVVSAAPVLVLSPLRHQAASCSNWLPIAALTYE